MNYPLSDIRAKKAGSLPPPGKVRGAYEVSRRASRLVVRTRKEINAILKGKSDRFLVVVGPCSIHDPEAAIVYAKRLVALQKEKEVGKKVLLVMRTYFEKPRTTVGWKGFVNDPHRDGSCDIASGLRAARKLLAEINNLGMPCATEFLDVYTPQYLGDLISYVAVGARTTESQLHRAMASGLSAAVGFKNSTSGEIQIAADAIKSAQSRHTFIGFGDKTGQACVYLTDGNDECHLILRGGKTGPNYSAQHVKAATELLEAAGVSTNIVVDCSHGNASGDYHNQVPVCRDVVAQRVRGQHNLVGVMLESFLEEGKQSITAQPLVYGTSVTDACIGWDDTARVIREVSAILP